MNKYKYLLKNIGLMTFSQFGSKILSFLLVPLYTSILTASQYGTYDYFNTTVSLLVPILTLSIMQGILRFTLGKKQDPSAVFTCGLNVLAKGFLVFFLLVGLNLWLNLIPSLNEFMPFMIGMFITAVLQETLISFARGRDRVKGIAIAGILSTATMLGLNVLFLVGLDMGLEGYFLANIISPAVTVLYLFIDCRVWRHVRFSQLDPKLRREMLVYSLPLILNSVAWWINSASDRYIVIAMCGVAANGIYSVAYKIPNILNMFQTIFNQVWTLSAVKDFDEADRGVFFSRVYSIYNFLMTFLCACVIAADRFLAHLLYAGDFFGAWRYVPFLLIAIVFGALSGYIGGVFAASKDSKIYAYSTVISAISNIVLNIVLILWLKDPMGAAIATAVSYCIAWVIRLIHLRKIMKLNIRLWRDCLAYGLLVVQSVLLLVMDGSLLTYLVQGAMLVLLLLMFLPELKGAIQTIKDKLRKSPKEEKHESDQQTS